MLNIDKSAFNKGEYVGYSARGVWRVRKFGSKDWRATLRDGGGFYCCRTLREISQKLEAEDKL
jgi:hypothetical protein